MKILGNQTLLYDADCPLCDLYTSGFIKAGMLDSNGRKNFSCLTADEAEFVDRKRASNEIALIDNDKKTVMYGIDSLLKVIGNSFPTVEKIGKIAAVNFVLRKLYPFVSYNRKVIIPNHIQQPNEIQCIPDFNYKYRIAYLIFGGLVTAYILLLFSKLIPQLPSGNYFGELALAFGQLAFQALFLRKIEKDKSLNYFGNLITVSLMGSLLLIPVIALCKFIEVHSALILIWFGCVVTVMFLEHFRRVKLLQLPKYLCVSWIVYRIIALIILLNLNS